MLTIFQLLPEKSLLQTLPTSSNVEDQAPPPSHKFDYTAFWDDALLKARASLQQEQAISQIQQPCPKVYVYNMTLFNQIDTKKHPRQFANPVAKFHTKTDALFEGYLFKTNQYSFASILEHRLLNSKCRTLDPDEADLYFAPILSAPKGSGGWTTTCQAITGKQVRQTLVHLNTTNACKHFLAIGKGHTDVPHCRGWFSKPIPELAPLTRLAYSSFNFDLDKHGGHFYQQNDTIQATHPNLVSVPYPSSLHYASNKTVPHFPNEIPRTTLMSFIGKDNHGDVKVRTRLHKQCKSYKDNHVCDWREKYVPEKDATTKAKAVFCLEPAGDTPGRKSLSDSITFGCIPVLFSDLTDDVAPWHWLSWKDRARVLIPRHEFLAGRIDVKRLLQSMPSELLAIMQSTLRTKSRQFQYSIDDDPEDGVRIILDNLHRQAQEKERQGTCGY
jgi:hypothetical protein